MFDIPKLNRRITVDVIFVAILTLLFWITRSSMQAVQREIEILFIASYALLGLGVLIYYLLAEMNFHVASLAHVGIFPIVGLFYLFGRWMPNVIVALEPGDEVKFSLILLLYVLTLTSFLVSQFFIHLRSRH